MGKTNPTVFNMAMEPDGDYKFKFKWIMHVSNGHGRYPDTWTAILAEESFLPSLLKTDPQAMRRAAGFIISGRAWKKFKQKLREAVAADKAVAKLKKNVLEASTREELASKAAEVGLDIGKMPFYDARSPRGASSAGKSSQKAERVD